MKVFVTGASGQLGYDVCRELERRGAAYRGTSSRDMDITDSRAVMDEMAAYRPDAVIHCAAYSAVDQAEKEPERCHAVNVGGTRNIALACREIGAKMLYISTDYVFSGEGKRPYEVDDPTKPLNVYGQTKLKGELAVREILERYFIVRTSWVYGKNGKNFVNAMLELAEKEEEINVVCDQVGSPTYTVDLAPLLCDMVQSANFGIYHAVGEAFCSRAAFAEEIFRLAGKPVRVIPVSSGEYPARAVRPLNSRLSTSKLEKMAFSKLPLWQDALRRYLAGY